MIKALKTFGMVVAGMTAACQSVADKAASADNTVVIADNVKNIGQQVVDSSREALDAESRHSIEHAAVPHIFTATSAAFVERFVSALSRSDFQRAFALFDPNGESYSAEQFAAMNQYFNSKVGSWERYDYVGTTIKEVYDQRSSRVISLPAYLYRIELESFSTPLLLVLFMDSSSSQPSILGYDFMPKETLEMKNVLRLWRSAIAKE